MNWTLVLSMLQGTITSGTSILFATLGGILCARVGVNNMGIEGIMLMGAAVGYGFCLRTGNAWAGFAGALMIGALMGLIYAAIVIVLRGHHVVTGLAFMVLGTGLSGY